MVIQALLRGMHDTDIRTRVLSRTQNEELKGLTDIVDYIAAEEASSASFSNMSPQIIAGQKSSYKKQNSHQSTPMDTPALSKCTHCGGKHQGNSGAD